MIIEIEKELRDSAEMFVRETKRGATESKAVAATLFEYYARGLIYALRLYSKPEADMMQVIADELTLQIDNDWYENKKKRHRTEPTKFSFEE